MQMREKVGKSQNTLFFQWFEAPEGRNVGSLKRRVRSQLARWEMKNCTPLLARSTFPSQNAQTTSALDHFWKLRLWHEAYFEVKMYKAPHIRTTFRSWDVEKVRAVVARSTFRSQNVTKHLTSRTTFGELRCRKSARRCGAKHISKSKFTKHHMFATAFGSSDVEKVHAVVARSTFRSQNVTKHFRGSDHFWRFRCRFAWQARGIVHLVKSEQHHEGFVAFSTTTTTTPHYTSIHYTTTTTTPALHSTTLHSATPTTLHYITLNYTQLHEITLHYITLQYTPLHYTTLKYTTLHYITLHYTPLH